MKQLILSKEDLSFLIDTIGEKYLNEFTPLKEKDECFRLMNLMMNIKVNYQPAPLDVDDLEVAYIGGEGRAKLVAESPNYYALTTREERFKGWLEIYYPSLVK